MRRPITRETHGVWGRARPAAYATFAAAVLHLGVPLAATVAPDREVAWRLLSRLPAPPTDLDIEAEYAPSPREPGAPEDAAPASDASGVDPAIDRRPGATDAEDAEGERPGAVAARAREPLPLLPNAPGVTAAEEERPGADPGGALTATDGDAEFGMAPAMVPYPGGGAGLGARGGGAWPLLGEEKQARRAAAPTTAPGRGEIPGNVAGKELDARLAEHDRGLGMELPAKGRVQGIVEAAMRTIALPDECQGAFAVSLGPRGELQGVQLLSYSGGAAGQWAEVVKVARAALASQKFAMRSAFEKGAVVTVHVSAKIRDISGAPASFATGSGSIGANFDITSAFAGPMRVVSSSSSVQPVP